MFENPAKTLEQVTEFNKNLSEYCPQQKHYTG